MSWPVRVQHSLNMIAELPGYTGDEDAPPALRAAALDSLYLHLYLVARYLIRHVTLPAETMQALDDLARFVAANVLSDLDAGESAEPFVLVDEARARADARMVIVAAELAQR